MLMLRIAVLSTMLLHVTSAHAQTECKAIQDTAARLACFDAPAKAQPSKKKTAQPEAKTSDDPHAKACTLKAAEALPKIPGLAIKSTRTAVQPMPQNWSTPIPPISVDVDIVAAGQADTYSYICATGSAGTVVMRVRK